MTSKYSVHFEPFHDRVVVQWGPCDEAPRGGNFKLSRTLIEDIVAAMSEHPDWQRYVVAPDSPLEDQLAAMTQSRDAYSNESNVLRERVEQLEQNYSKLLKDRDSLSGEVHRLSAELAILTQKRASLSAQLTAWAQERSRLRGEVDDLRQQVAQLEKERDMAFHAYDKLREEYLALTFDPVTPQLEDTFPEVGSEG